MVNERSVGKRGLRDGLSGVELEAEVAFGVAPEEFRFAGLGLAIIGKEGGAKFVGGL